MANTQKFHTRAYWKLMIKQRWGKDRGVVSDATTLKETEFLNPSWWFKFFPGKNQRAEAKKNRDWLARELRKDGWRVIVASDKLGYHLDAERYRKDKGYWLRRG